MLCLGGHDLTRIGGYVLLVWEGGCVGSEIDRLAEVVDVGERVSDVALVERVNGRVRGEERRRLIGGDDVRRLVGGDEVRRRDLFCVCVCLRR